MDFTAGRAALQRLGGRGIHFDPGCCRNGRHDSRLVLQLALVVEFVLRSTDEDFRRIEYDGVEKNEHRPHVILHARAAERPLRRRLNGNRLVLERLVLQPGRPVDRILERAGDGVIVFRRDDDDSVGRADQVGESRHRLGKFPVGMRIGVVERKLIVERLLEIHARGGERRQRPHQHPVVGALPQAAANRHDVHIVSFR